MKRLKINLAAPFSNSVQKSSRSFDKSDELVGLGIVAAMSTASTATTNHRVRAAKVLSKPIIGGSKSIPIRSSSGAGTSRGLRFGGEGVVAGGGAGGFGDEMSESYTCVISQIGNDRVRKREYFDDRVLSGNTKSTDDAVRRGVFSRSLAEVVEIEADEMPFFHSVDFLSSCFLCGKHLGGIDIFMYRGEKAFCSVECRDMQIATDKLKEKRGRVRVRSMEHSESPCCGPMLSYTGVVAA